MHELWHMFRSSWWISLHMHTWIWRRRMSNRWDQEKENIESFIHTSIQVLLMQPCQQILMSVHHSLAWIMAHAQIWKQDICAHVQQVILEVNVEQVRVIFFKNSSIPFSAAGRSSWLSPCFRHSSPCINCGNSTALMNGCHCTCASGYTGLVCQTDEICTGDIGCTWHDWHHVGHEFPVSATNKTNCVANAYLGNAECFDLISAYFCKCLAGSAGLKLY